MSERLYRSRTDQMIAGVCGGLGRYLKIDSTLVRLFFVLLALGSGIGLILYFILWILIPYEGEGQAGEAGTVRSGADEMGQRMRSLGSDIRRAIREPNPKAGILIGAALVIVGAIVLIDNLNLPWLHWLDFDIIWPVVLIVGGAVLIWRRFGKS